MVIIPATWEISEMIQAFLQAPAYHLLFEALLILWIIKLLFSKSYTLKNTVLTEKEKEELIADWKPEPLIPDINENDPELQLMDSNLVIGRAGKYLMINGCNLINMATLNFLGMVDDSSIEKKAIECLRKYGVGSCGPRGFYGTTDVHLELEELLAKYMRTEEVILYSYGFVTIASAIPAYSKRGDVIFCDEGSCFAIQKGLVASRSDIKFFKHNDMEDLEQLLIKQLEDEKKNPKKAKITRKFIVAEGLYANIGDICPLPKIIELKYKYKARIILDESCSFGVLGRYGRGVTEHFGIAIDEVDLIAASLENSYASTGGFCTGKKYIIDHQRLNGLGYCFSASQPPLLVAAAIQALKIVQQNESIFQDLRERCEQVHNGALGIDGLQLVGEKISPLKFLRLAEPSDDSDIDRRTLQKIVERARESGVALILNRFLEKDEHCLPPPSICIRVNCTLSPAEIGQAVSVIRKSAKHVISACC